MRIFKLIKNTYSEIAFKIGLLSMCIFKITISQSFTFSSYTVLCKLLTPDIYEVWLQNITSQILNFPNPSTRNFQFFSHERIYQLSSLHQMIRMLKPWNKYFSTRFFKTKSILNQLGLRSKTLLIQTPVFFQHTNHSIPQFLSTNISGKKIPLF
jgi:hypothetical protein